MSNQVFKYKKAFDDMISPANFSQAPAFSDGSTNKGDTGEDGSDGVFIFFTDYELNNSYYKNLTLHKIYSNVVLSSNRNEVLDRKYRDGDLVFTKSLSCYRIVTSDTHESGFDLEYIGKITGSGSEEILERIESFGISATVGVGEYSPNDGSIFSDRQMMYPFESGTASRTMIYITITPSINALSSVIDSIYDTYDISMEVQIPNPISMNGSAANVDVESENAAPEELRDIYKISKVIEFPIRRNSDGSFESFDISEKEADTLHLNGCEISSTIVKDCEQKSINIYDSTDYKMYYYANNGGIMRDTSTNTPVCELTYNDSSAAIKYSRYPDSSVYNFRGGECAYFSSFPINGKRNDSSTFSQYVSSTVLPITTATDASLIGKMMFDHIFNPDKNTYTLICRRKTDGYLKYMMVNPETINFKFQNE